MEFYKVITPSKQQFNVVVKKSKTRKRDIILGGDKNYCISISAPNNDINIKNDTQCRIQDNLESETNAKQMLLASIFVLKQYKNDCVVELDDFSEKDGLSLAYRGLAFDQKTWYEKHFNAYLKDEGSRLGYNLLKDNFNSKETKQRMTPLFEFEIKKEESPKELVKLYKDSSTIQDFFQRIKKECKTQSECNVVMKSWLIRFLSKGMGFHYLKQEKWEISCLGHDFTGYNLVPLKEDPYKGNYKFITQKGGSTKKTLRPSERKCFKNANWIGWLGINIDDYCPKDKQYLSKILSGK